MEIMTEQYFKNKKFKLIITLHEMRMSHWVDSPTLIDTESNATILDLTNSVWNLNIATETANSITLMLSAYPNANITYEVILYPYNDNDNGDASVNGHATKINKVKDVLDEIYKKLVQKSGNG